MVTTLSLEKLLLFSSEKEESFFSSAIRMDDAIKIKSREKRRRLQKWIKLDHWIFLLLLLQQIKIFLCLIVLA